MYTHEAYTQLTLGVPGTVKKMVIGRQGCLPGCLWYNVTSRFLNFYQAISMNIKVDSVMYMGDPPFGHFV